MLYYFPLMDYVKQEYEEEYKYEKPKYYDRTDENKEGELNFSVLIDSKMPLGIYLNANNELINFRKLGDNYLNYFPTFDLKRNDNGYMFFHTKHVDIYENYKPILSGETQIRS